MLVFYIKLQKESFLLLNQESLGPILVLILNCVLLADSVIGRLGTDILGISGIITPGTYYSHLQK
jgi:hypothetical protein